jgi:hypothetical protein
VIEFGFVLVLLDAYICAAHLRRLEEWDFDLWELACFAETKADAFYHPDVGVRDQPNNRAGLGQFTLL